MAISKVLIANRGEIAVRIARAKPLKIDSQMWWLLVPYSSSICRVMPTAWPIEWNQCSINSVSSSPSFSCVKAAFHTK